MTLFSHLLQISKWPHSKLIFFTYSCLAASAARYGHLNVSSLIVNKHILLILIQKALSRKAKDNQIITKVLNSRMSLWDL